MNVKFSFGLLFSCFLLVVACTTDTDVSEQNYSGERGYNETTIEYYNSLEIYDYNRVIEPYSNPFLEFCATVILGIFNLFSFGLAYFIIGALLIFILIMFLKSNRTKTPSWDMQRAPNINIITEEELETTDYEKLLKLALQENDLRLATRFTFLVALQYLQKRKKINWEKEKTNYQYLKELSPELQKPFGKLTRVYEYIWYGEAEATPNLFQNMSGYFENLKKLQP